MSSYVRPVVLISKSIVNGLNRKTDYASIYVRFFAYRDENKKLESYGGGGGW